MRPRFFYGWTIVLVAGLCYGFGMSPMYYSWSMFAPRLIGDLGVDRGDVGGVFGLFNMLYQFVGVGVAVAIVRLGLRRVMAAGFLVTAAGLLLLSQAETVRDCYVGFSILGGIGIGCSTIVPAQTLGQNWFLRRRALVIGVIFAFGGIVGRLVAPADMWLLEHYDWRTGWMVIAAISTALAVVAGVFVRETPETVGQSRDGATPQDASAGGVSALAAVADQWTAAQAIRTPQFALMLVPGVAYAVPFNTAVAHLTLHLSDLGHAETAAIGLVGTMALVSIGGRLIGAVGDWISPQWALAVALALEGLGAGGLLLAADATLALAAVSLIGLGFGLAYTSIPVVFSHFFGRRAFSVTAGIRMTMTGLFAGLGPWLAGLAFDATGSYAMPFIGLMLVGVAGAVCAAVMRHPGAPPLSTAAEVS
ncbi:MAG: MFS transporter [Acidobacteria bacterium]|nr:MFS transporter [Acidobacteriota bacterium]